MDRRASGHATAIVSAGNHGERGKMVVCCVKWLRFIADEPQRLFSSPEAFASHDLQLQQIFVLPEHFKHLVCRPVLQVFAVRRRHAAISGVRECKPLLLH